MAQVQKTIRFSEKTNLLVKQVSPAGEPNYNYGVNQIAERYLVMCAELLPSLADPEKLAICQAYNGHFFNSDINLEARAFSFQIKEALIYDGNVRELLLQDRIEEAPYDMALDDDENAIAILSHPICLDFIKKIEGFSIPQIISVFQMIHGFWENGRA